jgi:hypothetical protein
LRSKIQPAFFSSKRSRRAKADSENWGHKNPGQATVCAVLLLKLFLRKTYDARNENHTNVGVSPESTSLNVITGPRRPRRIYEFDDNKDYAVKLYDKAIQLGEVPGGAQKQALEGSNG